LLHVHCRMKKEGSGCSAQAASGSASNSDASR
jgi:hypothetical protein